MNRLLATLALAPLTLGLAACGDDDDDGGSSTSASASGSGALTVSAKEFSFTPSSLTAKAGKVKITLRNQGKTEHELVVLKTDADPASLKVKGGRVDEADSAGEIEETDGGSSASHTFDLQAGHYVYVCNIPGHYGDGMRGELDVR